MIKRWKTILSIAAAVVCIVSGVFSFYQHALAALNDKHNKAIAQIYKSRCKGVAHD